jgi:hypothetical protein
MVECGWVWGEMGKEGLRSLDAMGGENTEGGRSTMLLTMYIANRFLGI